MAKRLHVGEWGLHTAQFLAADHRKERGIEWPPGMRISSWSTQSKRKERVLRVQSHVFELKIENVKCNDSPCNGNNFLRKYILKNGGDTL